MNDRLMADISSNNPEFDAQAYAANGHKMIAIKASEGTEYVNPKHRGWCLHAGMHHIAVVHYHFGRPDLTENAADEADHFLHTVEGLTGHWDYLVLDGERNAAGGFGFSPVWSRQFDAHIRLHSRFKTILYASESVLGQADDWLVGPPRRVWDAKYDGAPSKLPRNYAQFARQFTDGTFGPQPHVIAGVGQCDVSLLAPWVVSLLHKRH